MPPFPQWTSGAESSSQMGLEGADCGDGVSIDVFLPAERIWFGVSCLAKDTKTDRKSNDVQTSANPAKCRKFETIQHRDEHDRTAQQPSLPRADL